MEGEPDPHVGQTPVFIGEVLVWVSVELYYGNYNG